LVVCRRRRNRFVLFFGFISLTWFPRKQREEKKEKKREERREKKKEVVIEYILQEFRSSSQEPIV